MEPIGLEAIEFERDECDRIVAVAGNRFDGVRLEYGVESFVDGSEAVATGTVKVDGESVLAVTARISHTDDCPTMTLTGSTGAQVHYSISAKVNASDASLSLSGHARGQPFTANIESGNDIPDDVPDVDAALPAEVKAGLEPLIPLIEMVNGSAGQSKRRRKTWWKRTIRYGCIGTTGAGAAAVCVATVGIGCVVASGVAAVVGALCADVTQ